jgi:hypothetical protein
MLDGLSGLAGLSGVVGGSAEPTQATGNFEFTDNPVDGDSLPAPNGYSLISFFDSPGKFPDVGIGATLEDTLSLLATALEHDKGSLFQIAMADYSSNLVNRLLIEYSVTGTVGNGFTLGEDTYNIARSAPTLTGGTD